jgi:S1-C subfamily serine protease
LESTDAASPARRATGVVLPSHDLVATAASAFESGESLIVTTSDGHKMTGVVSGVDTHAGVAVVQLPEPLAPASFADETVSPDQLAVAACRCGTGAAAGSSASPRVAVGMVRAVGTPATDDGGPLLVDAIEAEMPLASGAWGAVLVDDGGSVLGILDGLRVDGGDTFGYFVPAPLAVAVAEELAQDHTVHRGWLGVLCQDDGGIGAAVTSVVPGSPASLVDLRPGDVVEAVDSHLVRSLAELQARLYTSAPGTQLQLTVLRDGAVGTRAVTLVPPPS